MSKVGGGRNFGYGKKIDGQLRMPSMIAMVMVTLVPEHPMTSLEYLC